MNFDHNRSVECRASRPRLGVLMLQTRFPRLPGDVGHPDTWPFAVRYATVDRATVARVVAAEPDPDLREPLLAAARELIAAGVEALTTSCGFLVRWQAELQQQLPLPFYSSALMLVPELQAALPPGRRVGVLSYNARRLTPAHLAAAGAPASTPVAGLEEKDELYRVIRDDRPVLDPAAAATGVLCAARRLARQAPDLGAVVLECTNLPPYAPALRTVLGRPVFGLPDLIRRRLRGPC